MSSGVFEPGIYTSNAGNFFPCRAQPETKAAVIGGVTNDYGAGPVNQEVSAKLSGGKRENGCIARTVSLRWTAAPPTGYDPLGTVVIPAFGTAFYNASVRNATGTYLGAACRVQGRSPERVN